MRHRFLGLLLLLVCSFPLLAQSLRDSVTIEIVDIPVYVTRSGEPVQGLTREDFELYVNGNPQPIEYFDVIAAGDAADPAAPRTLRERRLFLLVFDLAFSPPHALLRAQRAAAEVIGRAPEGDLFAIATYSSRRGVWFATPFTTDRVALARGIGSLSVSRSGDPLAIVLTSTERSAIENWAIGAERSDPFFRDSARLVDRISVQAMSEMLSMELQRAVEDQILGFKDLAGRLSTLQGQKHVILLSQGYGMAPSMPASSVQSASFTASGGTGYPQMPSGIGMRGRIFRYLDQMHRVFQGGDVMLHAIDLRGVSSLLGNDGLHMLVTGTGGKFVHNRNNFTDALAGLSDMFSHSYLLGFKPVDVKRGHNKIEVKLRNRSRGMVVRHREGFAGTPQPFDVNEGLYLADVVLNDVPQTGTAAALELRESKLFARVPLGPVAAQLGEAGTAELLIYAFDADGVAIGFHRQPFDVAAGANGEKVFKVDMPEGTKVAKALLRVNESLGFSKTAMEVR